LRDATGVNFTSAEAHYSAARQIQQQALDARRRERSTMTDLPAHQILYDLQYGRGGDGDERKFVNVTDIAGPHADALLSQIERDRTEREQLRTRQQPQQIPPAVPMITSINDLPPGTNQFGFNRQHEQILREQQPMSHPSYPQGFNDADDRQNRSELILERRRQREQEEKRAEQLAFGTSDGDRSSRRVSYEPHVQTYEFDENVCWLHFCSFPYVRLLFIGCFSRTSDPTTSFARAHIRSKLSFGRPYFCSFDDDDTAFSTQETCPRSSYLY
jgi:hypothetical protein